ncbi:hypothetical protein F4781DRAFT_385188, partial [Annulohypoxylon bovei var. microspora]
MATSTSEGDVTVTPFVPGPHSWPNSTMTITHWTPVTGTSSSYVLDNGTSTSDSDTVVAYTSTVNVTLTLSPIPVLTTGGTDAATGSVSNTTSSGISVTPFVGYSTLPTSTTLVSNSSSQVIDTTTARSTVYTTVTETMSPSDNCTTSASETIF